MTRPKRLLLADHGSLGLHDRLRPLEALGIEVLVTQSPESTREALRAGACDLLVVDANGGAGSPGALDVVGRGPRDEATPVLLFSDPDDPIPAIVAGRAMRGGPWDLVRRDAAPEEILLRAERLCEQAATVAELERARYQASHDDRTGLLRPGPFDLRLREHFSAAQRHRLELALVLVDLDAFGAVNKQYDHTVGDEIIARAGSVIRMSLRAEDVGGRLGGDEFALVLPYTQRVDAARVVTRLAGRFRALSGPPPRPYGRSGHDDEPAPVIQVTASLGFETFDGSDLASVEDLRRRAERALHTAKTRGGDQGVYFRSMGGDGAESAAQAR
ncbi:MAG: GGDEF domain-containing protein [Planctomycetota bacterium]